MNCFITGVGETGTELRKPGSNTILFIILFCQKACLLKTGDFHIVERHFFYVAKYQLWSDKFSQGMSKILSYSYC